MSSAPIVYDAHRARYAFYQDAYWGGEYWRNPSSPTLGTARIFVHRINREADTIDDELVGTERSYLVPHSGETPQAFRNRHSLATYLNFVSPIVDAYADAATGRVNRDLGALEQYVKNLNGRRRSWDQHMSEVARWTGTYGWTATVFDLPKGPPAEDRETEEQQGRGIRATLVHPPAVAWVDVDDDGVVTEFAFVDQPFASELSGTSSQDVVLWVFDRQKYYKRKCKLNTAKAYGEQRDNLGNGEILDQGPHATPGRVPVEFCFFREVTNSKYPIGISLVADAADLAREVYNTLSNIGDIHRKTAFPFLAIPTKASTGALEPQTQVIAGPDKAIGYSSDTGLPAWVQPSAEQTKELRDHAVFLIGCAYRMAGLEVSTEGTSDVQSGLAIQLKNRGFESRCARFAGNLQGYEDAALKLCATILRQPAMAGFSVTYPKRYVLADASEDLARAVLVVQTLGDKLGPEGTVATLKQALDAALSLSDEELTKLVDELRAANAPKPPAGGPLGQPGLRPPPPPAPPPSAAPSEPQEGASWASK